MWAKRFRTNEKQSWLGFLIVLFMMLVFGGVISTYAFALTYSQDINVNFTFNSTLSLNLTSTDIVISSLVPNTAADSNIVNINVLTNSANGYTLNATVGNNTTYNTRDLVHSDTTQTAKFSSVDYSATPTIAANSSLDPNTWAYSYSTDNGTTWANYNGLPLWSDNEHIATLKDSNAPVADTTGDAIKFKIAAKADALQASGTYNNVINFTLVAKPVPTTPYVAFVDAGKNTVNGYYKMQDMTPQICSAIETMEEQFQLIDTRDNKVYWVAKLADGNCWMTQNLDHDIKTDSGFYTYANTDIGHGSTPNPSATWTASTATYATGVTTWNNAPTGYTILQSYDPGDGCWSGTLQDSTPVACSQNGSHFHLGNSYDWTAAVAMNNSSAYTTNGTDVDQSICPAGWTLPKDGSITTSGSLEYLITQYGYASSNRRMAGTYSMWDSPLYSPLSGFWDGSFYDLLGNSGSYWSSVVSDSGYAYSPNYDYRGGVDTTLTVSGREYGRPVRCVAR